jgi:GT2 family glycosyltransferase
MAFIDVLIPTYCRKTAFAVTLATLLGQRFTDFDVIVADQTPEDESYLDSPEIRTIIDALRWHGHAVSLFRRALRKGVAEQRDFLLRQARAPYVQFIDDDVVLEPGVIERLASVMRRERCGFVGAPAAGFPYVNDVRPHEQRFERWRGRVRPERFEPGRIPWERHPVNRAANPLHAEQRLRRGEVVRYKVCWVGGANVLYDRAKLLDVGGFAFWERLPHEHAGEDALVQFLLIRRYGGCGVLPCGTYHMCLPTNVPDRRSNATHLFETMLAESARA